MTVQYSTGTIIAAIRNLEQNVFANGRGLPVENSRRLDMLKFRAGGSGNNLVNRLVAGGTGGTDTSDIVTEILNNQSIIKRNGVGIEGTGDVISSLQFIYELVVASASLPDDIDLDMLKGYINNLTETAPYPL